MYNAAFDRLSQNPGTPNTVTVQTPLRVSLFGGGTDFPSFFRAEGGCVLTSAIDKHIFVTIKMRLDRNIRIRYTQTETVDTIGEIRHELIREVLRKTGICEGVEVMTISDITSAGSGLGSSSTLTVGALHAMYTFLGEFVSAERLAREACEIEIEILDKPIGVQDQHIAAYGGLRLLEFTTGGQILSEKIELDTGLKRGLEENLLLFFTGVTRRSDAILAEQKMNINRRLSVLREIKQMVYAARDELRMGNIGAIGSLLHESWQLKKQLASRISNGMIDEMYAAARRAGAIGGKITGAGGGGFLLLYCPEEKQGAVRAVLNHLPELPFQLAEYGTRVVFNRHKEEK